VIAVKISLFIINREADTETFSKCILAQFN